MGSSPTVGTRFRNRGYVFRIRGFLLLPASYANALKKSTTDRKKAHATNVTQVSFPYSIFEILGVPRGIRTPDLLVRSQSLYPAELWAHFLLRTVVLTTIAIISHLLQLVKRFFEFFSVAFRKNKYGFLAVAKQKQT